jgi:hypothetical protein
MHVTLRLQQKKEPFFVSFLLSNFLEYQFMEITPVLIIVGTKIPAIFQGIYGIFRDIY